MLTKDQAATARGTLYHTKLRNADGTPVRCRVNGKCKTWKTRPEEFQLPVKYGLRGCFYITPGNAHQWTTDESSAKTQEASHG